jgi:hypothetical protein
LVARFTAREEGSHTFHLIGSCSGRIARFKERIIMFVACVAVTSQPTVLTKKIEGLFFEENIIFIWLLLTSRAVVLLKWTST